MRDPKFDAPEFPARRCGRLDPHEPHVWVGYETQHIEGTADMWSPTLPAKRHCNGFVVIEGGAECVEHQRPMSECRYLHEVERRARWSE